MKEDAKCIYYLMMCFQKDELYMIYCLMLDLNKTMELYFPYKSKTSHVIVTAQSRNLVTYLFFFIIVFIFSHF